MAYQNQKVKARQTVTTTSQTKDLGIVSEVPMGEWSVNTQYKKLNTVRSHNATYIAKKDNIGVEPTVTQGWQEIWQVMAYDGGAVVPNGTYPEMTVGNATNATNDSTGKNITEQFSAIDNLIPSTASAENQLADKAFVNSSINNSAAFYITSNAQGDAFATKADLLAATTFYSGGQPRIPTQNDYATVLSDESQPAGVNGTYPTTRYTYQTSTQNGQYPNGQWELSMVVNNTTLTQTQLDAINSGITKELVEQIGKGNVLSVNGQTGAVTITPANIGALPTTGGVISGSEITIEAGLPYCNGVRLDVNRLGIGKNGIAMTNPGTKDDAGWIRILGTKEADTVLEIATGDDGGAGEAIVVRQYDTSNNVKRQLTLLETGGEAGKVDVFNVFKIDPSKLEPTTANGWTVGGIYTVLPEKGVYLMSVNGGAPGILFNDGNDDLQRCTVYLPSVNVPYSLRHTPDGWKMISPVGADFSSSISAIWFKRIA